MNRSHKLEKSFFTALALAWLALWAWPAGAEEPPTPEEFLEICRTGTPEQVAQALAAGADPDDPDENGRRPLTAFGGYGGPESDPAKARLLLAAGADPNRRDRSGRTALHAAAARAGGWPELVEILVEAGAEVNAVDHQGRTPLTLIFCYGDMETEAAKAEILLRAGADPDRTDPEGRTLLHHAVEEGSQNLVRTLAAGGAGVNLADRDGLTPLTLLPMIYHLSRLPESKSATMSIAEILLGAGADPNRRDRRGDTMLHKAVFWGSPELAEKLLAAGADVDAVGQTGWPPLMHLCNSSDPLPDQLREDLLKAVLAAGPDFTPALGPGQMPNLPLEMAAYRFGPDIVQMLLEAGAPVNGAGRYHGGLYRTALMAAARTNTDPAVAALLLKAGADPHLRGVDGLTALEYARLDNRSPAAEEIVRLLLEAMKGEGTIE